MKKFSVQHKKTIIIVSLVLVLVTGEILAFQFYIFNNSNRAADVVKPIEQALQDKGGIKECSDGDSGRGWDNRSPWYQVFYYLPVDVANATSVVNDIAGKQGYALTHASPTDRGFIGGVADAFIDKWYYDRSNKQNPYDDMQAGAIRLAFVVDGPGSTYECGNKKLQSGYSVVGIDVRLSSFK